MFQVDPTLFQIDPTLFQIDPWLIVTGIIIIVIFGAITIIWGIKAHRHKIGAGKEELIGRTAEVKETLDPRGIVLIEGEMWTAISETGKVEAGEEVTINGVDNLKLYVSKKTKGGK
ncbi:NfeD family protein [Chloroflexota bacterium]